MVNKVKLFILAFGVVVAPPEMHMAEICSPGTRGGPAYFEKEFGVHIDNKEYSVGAVVHSIRNKKSLACFVLRGLTLSERPTDRPIICSSDLVIGRVRESVRDHIFKIEAKSQIENGPKKALAIRLATICHKNYDEVILRSLISEVPVVVSSKEFFNPRTREAKISSYLEHKADGWHMKTLLRLFTFIPAKFTLAAKIGDRRILFAEYETQFLRVPIRAPMHVRIF